VKSAASCRRLECAIHFTFLHSARRIIWRTKFMCAIVLSCVKRPKHQKDILPNSTHLLLYSSIWNVIHGNAFVLVICYALREKIKLNFTFLLYCFRLSSIISIVFDYFNRFFVLQSVAEKYLEYVLCSYNTQLGSGKNYNCKSNKHNIYIF